MTPMLRRLAVAGRTVRYRTDRSQVCTILRHRVDASRSRSGGSAPAVSAAGRLPSGKDLAQLLREVGQFSVARAAAGGEAGEGLGERGESAAGATDRQAVAHEEAGVGATGWAGGSFFKEYNR